MFGVLVDDQANAAADATISDLGQIAGASWLCPP
jgi:hypothetical protein